MSATERAAAVGLLLALATGLLGCPSSLLGLEQRKTVLADPVEFEIHFTAKNLEDKQRVQRALEAAIPKLRRWGTLHDPIRVHLVPTHAMLEEAVGRGGYDWLRAWARYDEIFIQAPKTWSLLGPTQREIDELLLHELTHCLMYQSSASRTGWTRKQIPLWFREGMASFTAEQGYRWPSLEELARYYDGQAGPDPVMDPEALYQEQSEVVYAVAHHTFSFLVRRYGEATVTSVMQQMRAGDTFPVAFHKVLGIREEAFVQDFRRYVRLRGFRGGRIRHGATPVEQRPLPVPAPSIPSE